MTIAAAHHRAPWIIERLTNQTAHRNRATKATGQWDFPIRIYWTRLHGRMVEVNVYRPGPNSASPTTAYPSAVPVYRNPMLVDATVIDWNAAL